MGGKIPRLLWGFLSLLRGFSFDLAGIGVAWRGVCDLWYSGVVGYLWSWRRLGMVGSGVVV
jgi:hypothetical protein